MKKLFISVPMKGRTMEAITASMSKMHKLAEVIFDQPLTVLDNRIEYGPPAGANESIWYLARSIEKMAEADYFIGISGYFECFKRCFIERQVAEEYGITHVTLGYEEMSHIMPDAMEVMESLRSHNAGNTTAHVALL